MATRFKKSFPCNVTRSSSAMSIVAKLFGVDVAQCIADSTNELWTLNGVELSPIRIEEVYAYFNDVTSIMKEPKKTLYDHWLVTSEPIMMLSRDRFREIHNYMIFDYAQAAQLLSARFSSVITPGTFITVDEVLFGYTGKTPYKKFMANKHPKKGHLFYEAAVKLDKYDAPYVMSIIPWTKDKKTVQQIVSELIEPISMTKEQIIVTDRWYMCGKLKKYYEEKNYRFLAACNKNRFKPVWDLISKDVKHFGQYQIATEEKTSTLAITTSDQAIFNVLTNAYKIKSSNTTKTPLPNVDYQHQFNACDLANRVLKRHKFKFVAKKWNTHINLCFFNFIRINAYALYLQVTPSPTKIPFDEFVQLI